jgi:hypothetical protein
MTTRRNSPDGINPIRTPVESTTPTNCMSSSTAGTPAVGLVSGFAAAGGWAGRRAGSRSLIPPIP